MAFSGCSADSDYQERTGGLGIPSWMISSFDVTVPIGVTKVGTMLKFLGPSETFISVQNSSNADPSRTRASCAKRSQPWALLVFTEDGQLVTKNIHMPRMLF